MMIKKRYENWKKKKIGAKLSDIIFVLFIVALIIPSTRLEVMGFVNKVKAKIIQPSLEKESQRIMLSKADFNWEIISLEKGRTNLSKFRNKVVFVNFWATWCPPCVGELPEIQKMVDHYKFNDEIVFILVSSEQPETIISFLDKRGYTLPVYVSYEQPPQAMQSRSIPTSFLISKKGEIVLKEKGAVNWSGKKMKTIIDELLVN